jgi:RNA polymerase sigma factor (sigma-70 family)
MTDLSMPSFDSDDAKLVHLLETAFSEGGADARAAEARLVHQARQGSREAFSALYRSSVASVYRYCWMRVDGHQADAEDLTSKVFLRAWQSIGQYDERGRPFLAWLNTIARNTVIDHLRRSNRTDLLDESLPASDDIADDVARRIEHERLRGALGRLTPEQRQVLIYQFVLGYRSDETAAIMGKRAGAIRALQMRALQALRVILAEDQP